MNPCRTSLWGVTFLTLAVSLPGAGPGQKKLPPEYEQFLSEVRYIITSAERKDFLNLPDSGKAGFIEEFWKRRDPDPSTPENEFKDEYLGRIAKADDLFFGEGRPGWLTDRGRIYVLFGPPTQRQTSPPSADARGRCQELWYYRDFPVVFVDRGCSGTFMLETFDLSPIADLSLARESAPKPFPAPPEEKPSIDFDVILKRRNTEAARFEALVEISLPYKALWLSFEGGKFLTTFEVKLELRDNQNVLLWENTSLHDLSLTADELKQKMAGNYQIPILILIEKGAETLSAGKNTLLVILNNKKVGEDIRKKVEFSF
jgi:GWxTD domain-containing protein